LISFTFVFGFVVGGRSSTTPQRAAAVRENHFGFLGVSGDMRITASLLVCCTAAGVAVGALALDPIRREPSRPPTAAASTPVTTTATTAATDARANRRGTATTTAAAPAPAAAAVAMTIKGFRFEDVHAAPGATVNVTNSDSDDHTVTAKDGGFGITVPAGGQNSFVAPSAPGTYSFYCQIHPGMTGKLVVG
jgi:plastocyanin